MRSAPFSGSCTLQNCSFFHLLWWCTAGKAGGLFSFFSYVLIMCNNTMMELWHHELDSTAKYGQQHYSSTVGRLWVPFGSSRWRCVMLGDPLNQRWWHNTVMNITCGRTRDSNVSPIGKAELWFICLTRTLVSIMDKDSRQDFFLEILRSTVELGVF